MNVPHCKYHACRKPLACRWDKDSSSNRTHGSRHDLSSYLARDYDSDEVQNAEIGLNQFMEPPQLSDTAKYSQQCERYRSERHDCMKRRGPGRQYFSEYCVDHTCEFFFGHEDCHLGKSAQNLFCNAHTKCLIPQCNNVKDHYMDIIDQRFRSHEFCSNHLCASSKCELLCDALYIDGSVIHFGRYCYKHRCSYSGCDKPGMSGRNFCTNHQCKYNPTACQLIAVNGHKLCYKHVKCAELHCDKPRHCLPAHTPISEEDRRDCKLTVFGKEMYLNYCETHGKCHASGCAELCIWQARFCRKHFCLERNCSDSRGSNAKFCNLHQCQWSNCEAAKDWKLDNTRLKFCTRHCCRQPTCPSGVGDDQLYCVAHKCSKEGCVNKLAGGGLCYDHAVIQSQSKTRDHSKEEAQDWIRLLHPSGAGLGPSIRPQALKMSNSGKRSVGREPYRRAAATERQAMFPNDDDYNGSSFSDINNIVNDGSDSDSDSDNIGNGKDKGIAGATLTRRQGGHGDIVTDKRPKGTAGRNSHSKQPMPTAAGLSSPPPPLDSSSSNLPKYSQDGQTMYPQSHIKGNNQRS